MNRLAFKLIFLDGFEESLNTSPGCGSAQGIFDSIDLAVFFWRRNGLRQRRIFGVSLQPLSTTQVEHLLGDDDFRWINRGAIDLMDYNPEASKSSWGLPKAQTLYGSLPKQLRDPESFVSKLKWMLKVRHDYSIHLAQAVDVPNVDNQSVFILVMKLPKDDRIAITAINFGRSAVVETINLGQVEGLHARNLSGHQVLEIMNKTSPTAVMPDGTLSVKLDGLEAKVLVIQ